MRAQFREGYAFENPANKWRSPTEQPRHKRLSLSQFAPVFSKMWHGCPAVITNWIILEWFIEPHYRSLTHHLVDPAE